MAFQFKARVLLELGAELISSDAIALYELVKNSIDAQVETAKLKVTVDIKIALRYSVYGQLLMILDGYEREQASGEKLIKIMESFNKMVSGCLEKDITPWSKGQFEKTYAFPVSIKEARDNLKEAYFLSNKITVRDNASGMTMKILDSNFLTVGTPTRLNQKQNAIEKLMDGRSRLLHTEVSKGIPLGEKGIGRLSAMRLGQYVVLRTKQAGESKYHELVMDWEPAFCDPTLDANDPILDFKPISAPCKADNVSKHGTSILIRDLQSDWNLEKVIGIIKKDFSKLADPFSDLLANKFIEVLYQNSKQTINVLDREPLKHCDAIVEAKFRYDENMEPELRLFADYRLRSKVRNDCLKGEHLRACVRDEGYKRKKNSSLIDDEVVASALKHLGPWEMKFYWFNRGRLLRKHHDLYMDLVDPFLEQWSGGLLIYRDGYRVYPYAERLDDWLGLDKLALSGKAFKLNRAQIVGYVRISSIANPMLVDQTNREGFRDSLDKEVLKRLLTYAVAGFCKPFLEAVEKEFDEPIEDMVHKVEKNISTSKVAAISSLKGIQEREPQEGKNIALVMQHLEEVSEAWERAKLRIAALDQEVESVLHLAGVGLMLEFIAHELSRVTQDTLKAITSGKLAPDAVQAQLKTLEKRVRILDEMSIPGRQIRQFESILSLTKMLIEFHQTKAQRHSIDLEVISGTKESGWQEKVEKGQFLQILDNLFSNSFYWLSNRIDNTRRGVIKVRLDAVERSLTFTDNGPGIPSERAESVFNQFFTTKPPREGRGLGLYIARRLASENNAILELIDPDVDGMYRSFKITFGKSDSGRA